MHHGLRGGDPARDSELMSAEIREILAATVAAYPRAVRRIAVCEWNRPAEWVDSSEVEVGHAPPEESMSAETIADAIRRITTTNQPVAILTNSAGVVAATVTPGVTVVAEIWSRASVGVATVAVSKVVAALRSLRPS